MIIAILHAEKKLQTKDLTRYDASKSILVKGSINPINAVKIKAGADGTFIDVFNANVKNWFLDWAFNEYAFDVDASNSDLVFEANGLSYSTNVLSGTYTLANLTTAIKNAIEAIAPPLTVSVTVDDRNRVSFDPSSPLTLLPKATSTGLLRHLGFTKDGQLTGTPVEYGLRKVTLQVESISENATVEEYIQVYTEEGDSLFSQDSDLVLNEHDIMKWLPVGRGSYKDLHRKSQTEVLDWCDRQGYRDDNGDKITKWAFVDKSDVNLWSTYLALKMFFMGVNNQEDDVFKQKAAYYEKKEIEARDRAVLNLDLDGDNKVDEGQGPDIRSARLYFR